ncbi:hypothetical protein DL96DRAFT_1603440 [Flagelloscypha sp. PMI_526]|nr:hypothetical protein DL96DRAFT_1603440 [Flagelloscypha sp. PMI_526]
MTSVTPRWRVSRSEETPVAGPSRLPDAEPHVSDSAQSTDAEFPTPKLATLSLAQNATNSSVGHALKLRELLDRMPKEKEDSDSAATTPVVRKPAVPLSDVESDLEFPNITVGEPSHAQESLKDLFSRIWTQPGNTPEKRTPGRPRRNSVDVSEVESSPRVQRERSANKGHRKSMSDEETEKQGSNNPATFDLLRQRLNDSQTNILNQAPPTLNNIYSTIDNDTDNDTETFFRGISESGQYPATSTPQDGHSLRLSTNSEDPFQSRKSPSYLKSVHYYIRCT